MMKTKEELDALREEVAELNRKLAELSDEELKQVTAGEYIPGRKDQYDSIILNSEARPG